MKPGVLIGTVDEIKLGEAVRQALIDRCEGHPDTQEWIGRLTIAHWFVENANATADELIKLHQTIEAFALVLRQKPENNWLAHDGSDVRPAAYLYDQVMSTKIFGEVY